MVRSSEAIVSSEVWTSTREGLAGMTRGQAEWQQADSGGSLPQSGMETHGAASTATLQLESSVDQQSALVYSLDIGASYPEAGRAERNQLNDGSLHALLQASGADAESQPAAAQHPSDAALEEVYSSNDLKSGFSSLREHAVPDMSDDSAASQEHSAGSAPVSTAQRSAAASQPSVGRSDELRSSAGSTGSQRFRSIASTSAIHYGSAPGSGSESPHSSGRSGTADVPSRQARALPASSMSMQPEISETFGFSSRYNVLYAPRRNYTHSLSCGVLHHSSALSARHTVAGIGNLPAYQHIWPHF